MDFGFTDEQLAARAQTGDDHALDLLIERYHCVVAAKVASYSDFDVIGFEPDDLKQEGLIGLFSAVMNFRDGGGASFKTYANICVERRLLSCVKSAHRKKSVPSGALVPQNDEISDIRMDSDPAHSVIAREDYDRLMKKLNDTGSELEFQVLCLSLSGFGYREIAAKIGCTEKSVDNALARLRKKIKDFRL